MIEQIKYLLELKKNSPETQGLVESSRFLLTLPKLFLSVVLIMFGKYCICYILFGHSKIITICPRNISKYFGAMWETTENSLKRRFLASGPVVCVRFSAFQKRMTQ